MYKNNLEKVTYEDDGLEDDQRLKNTPNDVWELIGDHLLELSVSRKLKGNLNDCRLRIGNMEMEHDIKSMTINEYLEYEAAKKRQLWDNLDDDQEEGGDDRDIFYMWDITVERMSEVFGDEHLECDMVDERAGYNNEETKLEVTSTRNYVLLQVDAHGVVLGSFFSTGRHFKFGLVRYQAKDDDGIFVIMDVARRRRLGAWLRALHITEQIQGSLPF
ncbi:hypothetical protein Tco_0758521 [Tanacetum coccineum]